MDYNKSIYFNPTQANNLNLQKHLANKNKINSDKRKSYDISINKFLNNLKDSQKNKLRNIPIKYRPSWEYKNLGISNIMKENSLKNDSTYVKDKNHYMNLVNNIYTNDSHLSNNKIFKSQNIKKNFEKRETINFSKRKNSKDNWGKKSSSKCSKKKLSYCSNDLKNNFSNKITQSNDFKNRTTKKLSNFTNEENERRKKFEIDNFLLMQKFQSSHTISKLKKNINFPKMKSSHNIMKNNEKEIMNDTIKEEIKKQKKFQNDDNAKEKKIKHIIKNERNEVEKCQTENILNKNDSNYKTNNNNIIENKKSKKKFRFCLFCCLNSRYDSFE